MIKTPWTPERVERLRQLWAEGHSGAQIGRLTGMTKCAVLGKAHRLGLPPRPSPIPFASGKPKRPKRVIGPTLAPVASPPSLPDVPPLDLIHNCMWPLGDPKSVSFRFCTAPCNGVYCDKHRAIAYIPFGAPRVTSA